jgi:hypothetical protein
MLNINRTIANSSAKQRKNAKIIVGVIAGVLFIADVFFAIKEESGFPTFSKLFKDNNARLLWFTFLFGCLVGKIFYNRFTNQAKKERKGVLILAIIVLALIGVGNIGFIPDNVPVWAEALLFAGGIVCASSLWPQYKNPALRKRKFTQFESVD